MLSVSLAPHMDFASYVHQYYDKGYLVYQDTGDAGKVCADSMNKSVPNGGLPGVLTKLGESMCTVLEYKNLISVDVVKDEEADVKYVDMIGPISDDKSFITVPCQDR